MSANWITHASLCSGLSSVPALCLFFLQWRSSSVYNSHPKPSLWNILPAAAARHAKALLTSPDSVPIFAQFARASFFFFTWNYFPGDKRGCKLIWNAWKFFSFHVSNPSACDGFHPVQLQGTVRREAFVLRLMLGGEGSLYPPALCRLPSAQLTASPSHTSFGDGSGVVCGVKCVVAGAISTHIKHHPQTDRRRGKSSEVPAAGFNLRVKSEAEDVKKQKQKKPLKLRSYQWQWVQSLKVLFKKTVCLCFCFQVTIYCLSIPIAAKLLCYWPLNFMLAILWFRH